MKHLIHSAALLIVIAMGTGCSSGNDNGLTHNSINDSLSMTDSFGSMVPGKVGFGAPRELRQLRGSENKLAIPCKVRVRFGSTDLKMEENLVAEALVSNRSEGVRYSLNINTHPKGNDSENCLNIRLSSYQKSLRDLEEGIYDMDYMQMNEKDLFWSVTFSPNETMFYELESGTVAFRQIKAQPNGGLFLQGSFDGVGGCFDLNRNGKLMKESSFSGDFEIYVQDPNIPAIL